MKETIKILEFTDGYCLTHNGIDYLYQGKTESVLKLIADKVSELLLADRQELIKKLLKENHVG